MISTTVLLAALIAAPSTASSIQSRTAISNTGGVTVGPTRRPSSLVDLGAGTGSASAAPTGGTLSAGRGGTSVTRGVLSQLGVKVTYYTVTISPGTGYSESFVVYAPDPMPISLRPALVAFHGFGVSQMDIVVNTSLLQECAARKWFMIAPLSASGGHFMCDPGQLNTQAAMDWALSFLPVDKSRIYGVGFSMGGGMALNYAARNLDPERGMFAAIVDHTGAADLNHVYASDPAAQFVFDFWYGDGTPGSADPDLMTRGSVMRYDLQSQQVDPESDLVRNIGHVALRMVRAANDPLAYLGSQCDTLNAYLQSLGRVPGPSFVYEVLPGNAHSWSTMDAKAACSWLAQFSLSMPSSGKTLASAEATYFHFFVDQDDPAEFTPFTWSIDTVANTLSVEDTSNLAVLAVDTSSAGLSTLQQLEVLLSTADAKADRVVLTGYSAPPASVLRDGTAAPGGSWIHNPAAQTLRLDETDGTGLHAWTVVP